MRMWTWIIAVLCVAVIVGCGGGSTGPGPGDGGGGGGGGNPNPTDPRAGEMLEDCMAPGLEQTQGLGALLEAMIAGNGSVAGFSILPGGVEETPETVVIRWEYDENGDLAPEASGDLSFFDETLSAIQPFTQPQIDMLNNDGIDALGTVLPTLPDGTVMRALWNGPIPGLATALLDISFNGGAAGGTTGNTSYSEADCNVTLDWVDVLLSQLVATFPSGDFQIVVTAGGDVLTGTFSTNGTTAATATVSLNNGNNQNWDFDVATGIATSQ